MKAIVKMFAATRAMVSSRWACDNDHALAILLSCNPMRNSRAMKQPITSHHMYILYLTFALIHKRVSEIGLYVQTVSFKLQRQQPGQM
jgi:hypothetical protein